MHKKFTSLKINSLCDRDSSGAIRVVYFNTARPLMSFARHFYVLTKRLYSSLFRATWSDTIGKAIRRNPNLSIKHIESEVWVPAFQQCQNILQELFKLTMTLHDVDQQFSSYGGQDLKTQLKLLFCGINECTHQQRSDHWIQRPVQKILHHRQLCSYRDAANSFLELRDLLKLSGGDFRDVERISKKVKIAVRVVIRWLKNILSV